MLIGLIVFCEVMFWVFIVSGLFVRYALKKKKLGMVLLALSPVVDVVLLGATAVDLHGGGEAAFAHALAAIYLGVSLVFGKKMVAWADAWFSYRFADGPRPPKKPKAGKAHAALERLGWLRHLAAYAIGCVIMGVLMVISSSQQASEVFFGTMGTWGIILLVDFAISFSYTLFPRKEKQA